MSWGAFVISVWSRPLPIPGRTNWHYGFTLALAAITACVSGWAAWMLFKENQDNVFGLWSMVISLSWILLGMLSLGTCILILLSSNDWIEAIREYRAMLGEAYPPGLLRGQEMVKKLNLSNRTDKYRVAGMYAIHLKLLEEGYPTELMMASVTTISEPGVILRSGRCILTHDGGRTTELFAKIKGSGREIYLRSIDRHSVFHLELERAAQALLHEIKASEQFAKLDGLVHEIDAGPAPAPARRL